MEVRFFENEVGYIFDEVVFFENEVRYIFDEAMFFFCHSGYYDRDFSAIATK
jgi:hypothetical protein